MGVAAERLTVGRTLDRRLGTGEVPLGSVRELPVVVFAEARDRPPGSPGQEEPAAHFTVTP